MGGTSESDRKLLALPGVAGVAGTGVAGGVLGGKELVVEIRPLAKSHMKKCMSVGVKNICVNHASLRNTWLAKLIFRVLEMRVSVMLSASMVLVKQK